MPRIKFENLQSQIQEYKSILLTTKEEYKGTSNIKWKCFCGMENETSYKTFTRWVGRCSDCRKNDNKKTIRKERVSKYTYEYIYKIYEDADCQLLSTKEEYSGPRKSVKWCCRCGNIQDSSFNAFNMTKRCRTCGIRAFKGVSYETFCELLQEDGWKMLDNEDKYKDTSSRMKVLSVEKVMKCIQLITVLDKVIDLKKKQILLRWKDNERLC